MRFVAKDLASLVYMRVRIYKIFCFFVLIIDLRQRSCTTARLKVSMSVDMRVIVSVDMSVSLSVYISASDRLIVRWDEPS